MLFPLQYCHIQATSTCNLFFGTLSHSSNQLRATSPLLFPLERCHIQATAFEQLHPYSTFGSATLSLSFRRFNCLLIWSPTHKHAPSISKLVLCVHGLRCINFIMNFIYTPCKCLLLISICISLKLKTCNYKNKYV